MKTNITRILCLVLVLLMSVTVFAACKKGDDVTKTDVSTDVTSQDIQEEIIVEVTDDDPYTVSKDKDGKDIVILTPNADGSVTMTVAEKTTLEAFLAVVAAKEGHAIKVLDAEGKEVTDVKTVIAKGMKFQVFADGADAAKVEMIIDVVTEKQIEATVQKNEEIKKENSEVLVNKPVQDPGKDPEKNPEDGDKPSDPGDSKPIITDPEPNKETVNITLSSVWASHYTASDATGKIYQATLNSMKKQGIETKVVPLDASSATDTIVKDVMAGKVTADLYDISLVMCRNVARKKAAANVFDSKTLNKSLYQSGATASVTFGGKVYGVAYPAKSANPMGVIYNKDLVAKYASDYDIVKLYNSKKWNFDAFKEIAKLCTKDTDGDGATNIYGFTSNTNVIGMALTSNAGGTALMVNGKVEATMCNDSGVAALEWCKAMYSTDKTWLYKADINSCVNDFGAGKAAMFVSYLQYYPTIASKANFAIGFVPMPIGPDQTDYKNGVYDASLFVVPKTNEARLDDIGNWLNIMATAGTKMINQKVTEMTRNGLDSTSTAVYKWVVNNMTPEYSSGAFSSKVSSEVDSSVTVRSKSPAKVMAAIKSQAQKECDDYYADLY